MSGSIHGWGLVLSVAPHSLAAVDDLDRAILDLEQRRYLHAGAKVTAIAALGLSPTGYYQRLNRLLDDPAAALARPQLVARLRRLRDGRLARRRAA